MQQRATVIIGNWKMHKTIMESCAFVKHLVSLLKEPKATIGVAVPFTALSAVADQIRKLDSKLLLGAQNLSDVSHGAYTGEISSTMLQEAGADFVLVGHSERRHLFHESNALVNRKVKRALEVGLTPIVCIGETAEQKERGETNDVLHNQIFGSLEGLTAHQMENLMLAYEPVWAIGTGKVSSPLDAAKAHAYIRSLVQEKWGKDVANALVIQYGGSVKPENAKQLLEKEDIDGLLVGGASLEPLSFEQIITKA